MQGLFALSGFRFADDDRMAKCIALLTDQHLVAIFKRHTFSFVLVVVEPKAYWPQETFLPKSRKILMVSRHSSSCLSNRFAISCISHCLLATMVDQMALQIFDSDKYESGSDVHQQPDSCLLRAKR